VGQIHPVVSAPFLIVTSHDLSKMEEVKCPDCGRPLIIVPAGDDPSRYKFEGCRCGREEFILPIIIAAGFGEGPLLLYAQRNQVR
jgi:hypothetical protein